jgi:hypothetical protein
MNASRVVGVLLGLTCAAASVFAAERGRPSREIKPCVVITGADSRVKVRGYLRVTSTVEWARLWQEHKAGVSNDRYDRFHDELTLPLIDFESYMAVAMFEGKTVNSAGLVIVSISEDEQRITVRFEEKGYQTENGADTVTPYAFVVVPRSAKTLVLEENVQQHKAHPPVWEKRATLPGGNKGGTEQGAGP